MAGKRFRFGICIWDLPERGPEACSLAAEYGLEGIELDMGSWDDGLPLSDPSLRDRFLKASKDSGIIFPTLGANALCDHGMSKSGKKETVRQIFSAMVETAAAMGIPKLQVPSFIDGFITNSDEFNTTAENLRELCDMAAERGLIVGTENALSAADNLRLAEVVNKPNLRFYFDTSNPFWFGGGMSSPAMIPLMQDLICEYHVKDEIQEEQRKFVPLGEGGSTFHEAAEALMDTEYSGWILLENDYSSDLTLDHLRQDISTLRRVFVE